MEYDFNGIVDDVDFIPALIPQPGSTSVRNQFQMGCKHFHYLFKVGGENQALGNFIAYTAGTSVEVERLLKEASALNFNPGVMNFKSWSKVNEAVTVL